ncbi:metallophosphoesterase [Paraglaciecola sp. T6c]|uniref:metallophosphoesterase family protein n=1 Tax=Pseudoalteromonas atlantica (strain T6c / ATCC BAA-1087) TaxID=3042615 RepID=UPI00005C7179|nr:metallophosphoesterase [Paraglaciecola sp. T6c]ABG38963.1 metallophosphoesterase [Paraglaciecola sp. T6c]
MSFKVAQISDCHLFADKRHAGYQNINPYTTLQAVLKNVGLCHPDMVIVSGDVSAENDAVKGLASYQLFSQLWQQSKISAPLLVIPGNHDHLEALNNELNHLAGWPLSTSAGPYWKVHGLNTKTDDSSGEISMRQLQYLNEQVNLHPQQHHLLVVHHHPYACGGWMDNHPWRNRDEFIQNVEQQPQIKAVIYGHIHQASETRSQDCVFMSAPSTCWQWANSKEFSASGEAPGYRVIELADNGQVDSHIIRI